MTVRLDLTTPKHQVRERNDIEIIADLIGIENALIFWVYCCEVKDKAEEVSIRSLNKKNLAMAVGEEKATILLTQIKTRIRLPRFPKLKSLILAQQIKESYNELRNLKKTRSQALEILCKRYSKPTSWMQQKLTTGSRNLTKKTRLTKRKIV